MVNRNIVLSSVLAALICGPVMAAPAIKKYPNINVNEVYDQTPKIFSFNVSPEETITYTQIPITIPAEVWQEVYKKKFTYELVLELTYPDTGTHIFTQRKDKVVKDVVLGSAELQAQDNQGSSLIMAGPQFSVTADTVYSAINKYGLQFDKADTDHVTSARIFGRITGLVSETNNRGDTYLARLDFSSVIEGKGPVAHAPNISPEELIKHTMDSDLQNHMQQAYDNKKHEEQMAKDEQEVAAQKADLAKQIVALQEQEKALKKTADELATVKATQGADEATIAAQGQSIATNYVFLSSQISDLSTNLFKFKVATGQKFTTIDSKFNELAIYENETRGAVNVVSGRDFGRNADVALLQNKNSEDEYNKNAPGMFTRGFRGLRKMLPNALGGIPKDTVYPDEQRPAPAKVDPQLPPLQFLNLDSNGQPIPFKLEPFNSDRPAEIQMPTNLGNGNTDTNK